MRIRVIESANRSSLNKIGAIRVVKDVLGLGLAEAKSWVESGGGFLHPDQFSGLEESLPQHGYELVLEEEEEDAAVVPETEEIEVLTAYVSKLISLRKFKRVHAIMATYITGRS